MAGIESEIDSDASDEGKIEVIQMNDPLGNNDDGNDDSSEDESGDELDSLTWTEEEPQRVRRGKKDILRGEAKLQFNPKSILECFDNFMPRELKQLIIDCTNLKGE